MRTGQPVIVTIPAKNEEDRIGKCLRALSNQSVAPDMVLLFLNNCTDKTREICEGFAENCQITIVEETLAGDKASAGEARRRALMHAEQHPLTGTILTTDADSCPPFDWIENNLRAIGNGADLVCGRAVLAIEEAEPIRLGVRFDDLREVMLLELLDEIDSIIDVNFNDPWPRHSHDSGASLALRAGVLRLIGGAPEISSGEDRALVERCRMIDLKIRHDPRIFVHVSGRLEGRALGGMAETIKRRTHRLDEFTDQKVEPTIDAYRRSLAKARFRACWSTGMPAEDVVADFLIDAALMDSALASPFFGAAWDMIQARSPVLQRRRVTYTSLAAETRQALQLRDSLVRQLGPTAPPIIVEDHAV